MQVSEEIINELQALIKLRAGSKKEKNSYHKAFKNEDVFVHLGDEFIPLQLIKNHADSKTLLKAIKSATDKPQIIQATDKLLSQFYRTHRLIRDINTIADSISYYVMPQAEDTSEKPSASEFININTIVELSEYQSQAYSASDDRLKEVGAQISRQILMPVNFWLDTLPFPNLTKEPERYWQVAGFFKPFFWGKLFAPEHTDKKVFFSIGIDLKTQTAFYGLECLRTGSNKLTADQLLKFDYFTAGKNLRHDIPLEELEQYNWNKLNGLATTFIESFLPLYHEIIDYIWDEKVSAKNNPGKLLKIGFDKAMLTDEPYLANEHINEDAIKMVMGYEKETLALRGKKELSKKVALIKAKDSLNGFDVMSYNLDGSAKWIKVLVTKSRSLNGCPIENQVIQKSKVVPEKCHLYMVLNYGRKRKSGLLMIKKGHFDNVLNLTPLLYTIGADKD